MKTSNKTTITIETIINTSAEKVWKCWTLPEHIIKWNNASPDWHTPHAENDLIIGGKFLSRMEAKDGTMGFDFEGVYKVVKPLELIEYTLGDDRQVQVNFIATGKQTRIIESFEAEDENPIELQRNGWQAILNNFKAYAESD